jgi:hypothetical protein
VRIDVNTFLGAYPWRRVPGTSPEGLLAALDRVDTAEAWVSHLPGVFWRAPADGNAWLYDVAGRQPRLRPVPAVHPGLAGWESVLADAVQRHVPAVRCDPTVHGLDPAGAEMCRLAAACGASQVPLVLAVRFEDGRQRHPRDVSPELPAAAVRALIRSDASVRLVVTHAERSFIEEVHFGSTELEARRIWWDISWVWGPPEDHLETLLGTVGAARFVFGSGMPLRLPELPVARLDLLDVTPEVRAAIAYGNVREALGA